MLQLLKINTDLKSHEAHFAERYERLLGWALHLTDHDRAQAEDLLHDAFIQFSLSRPDLEDIRNLDNYLFGVLRILRVSQLRRSSRLRLQQLSIIEYDSAELGLRMVDQTVDAGELLKIQDELRAVCRYACMRKESSKAGSVLILRFFHGYYPSEIAAVLRASRKVVDMRLQSARREAQAYCAAPERLSFLNAAKVAPKKGGKTMTTQTADDLLLELRNEIFRARNGECFASEEWRRMYASEAPPGEADAMDNWHLSHLVSCAACLDAVNQILGLPALAERHPNDTISPDKSGQNGGGGSNGNGGSGAIQRQSQQRVREVFEHRPRELFISVNGLILGSQKIHAELNEQTLELRPEDLSEPAGFIEVFSEQGLRLLLMPLNGEEAQATKVVLSDDRELEVSLRFRDPHPALSVTYCDPLMKPDEFVVPASAGISFEEPFRLKAGLRTFSWLRGFWPKRFAAHSLWQPRLVATLSLLLAVTALLAVWCGTVTPPVTAAELLQKSIVAETQTAAVRGQVTYRSFRLEEHDPATARVVSSRRVEVWQSADRGVTVRRLYDAQNRVVAGEWQAPDGSSKLYQRKDAGTIPDDWWRTMLASRSFAELIGQAGAALEDKGNVYILSYDLPENRQLRKATLTLNKSDLRAIEQSLLPRDSTARELRAVENAFEQLPSDAVPSAIFQPNAELANAELIDAGAKLIATPSAKSTPEVAASPIAAPKQAELAALEIEARYLLDQVNANLGEQISFTRSAGRLQIAALVETDKRKAELLSALAPLQANPAAAFDIATYAEAARRQPQPNANGALTVSEFGTSGNQIPAAAELRRYFAAQAPSSSDENWIESQIAQFASRIQRQAMKPLRHARALKTLIEQIPPAELETLDPQAKAKWRRMVQSHALAVQRETAALRAELQPIFFADAGNEAEATFSSAANLKQAAERLVALAASNDALVSRTFSRSSANADSRQLKAERFRQSLREAEKLAESIFKQE